MINSDIGSEESRVVIECFHSVIKSRKGKETTIHSRLSEKLQSERRKGERAKERETREREEREEERGERRRGEKKQSYLIHPIESARRNSARSLEIKQSSNCVLTCCYVT